MRPGRGRQILAGGVVVLGLAAVAGPVAILLSADRSQAAFSGQVEVDGRLTSASVDVAPGERTVPITVGALAPGDRATGTIEVVNAGSLPLHYALTVQPSGAPVESWLRWDLGLGDPSRGCGRALSSNGVPADARSSDTLLSDTTFAGRAPLTVFGSPEPGFDPGDRVLAPGQRELLCTAVTLPLGAPDEVQGATVTPGFVLAAEHHLEVQP